MLLRAPGDEYSGLWSGSIFGIWGILRGMTTWTESIQGSTSVVHLKAFAAYCVKSAKRRSRVLDDAVARLAEAVELEAVRVEVLTIAEEARDLISEQLFFGNTSVTTEGWDIWWSFVVPPSNWDYYITTSDGGSWGPYTLRQGVTEFHKPVYGGVGKTLLCDRSPDPGDFNIRPIASYPVGAKSWSKCEGVTAEEHEALLAFRGSMW